MVLLYFNSLPSLSSTSSTFPCSSRLQALPLTSPVVSLHVGIKTNIIESKNRVSISSHNLSSRGRATSTVIVKAAASGVDGTEAESNEEPKAVAVPVDELPLESKKQQLLEQRLKMKMAKKVRLRRKRLVRKRKMRKKGRWPPSKMKKLKNV